jgi:hypothetical protein
MSGQFVECGYDKAYVGKCKNMAGAKHSCVKHEQIHCGCCGKKASHECSYSGQFVCGAPLCDDCEGWEDLTKPAGNWGFLNHFHRVKVAK